MAHKDERPTETPTDDVELDSKALKDAEKDMHAGGTGDKHEDDPTHDHDKGALKEGAKGMHAK
jgi:hypothetical protein